MMMSRTNHVKNVAVGECWVGILLLISPMRSSLSCYYQSAESFIILTQETCFLEILYVI